MQCPVIDLPLHVIPRLHGTAPYTDAVLNVIVQQCVRCVMAFHAGAGMIFSQGLMRMRGFDQIEQAVRNMDWGHQGAGGGAPLHPAICLHCTWSTFDYGYPVFNTPSV